MGEASERKRLDAVTLIQEGQRLQADGHVEEGRAKMSHALQILEKSLELCSGNHRSRFVLVNCAISLDDFERAKAEGLHIYNELSLDQLRQMDDAVLHLSIAHASKMLGDTEDAIQFAIEATQLYEGDPQPHRILGELYESVGRDEEAEYACREAIRISASSSKSQRGHTLTQQSHYYTQCCLGAALIKQGKNQEAVQVLKETASTMDSPILALRHLCDAYHFQGKYSQALEA